VAARSPCWRRLSGAASSGLRGMLHMAAQLGMPAAAQKSTAGGLCSAGRDLVIQPPVPAQHANMFRMGTSYELVHSLACTVCVCLSVAALGREPRRSLLLFEHWAMCHLL
jgi:hypothetical protein